MERFQDPAKYREHARAKLAGVFGWEGQFDTTVVDPDARGFVDVSLGAPVHGINALYTSGVAWPAYSSGQESGTELLCAATAEALPIAKVLLKFAANLLVKQVAPRVGLYGRDYRAACGLGDGAARHAFLAPPLFWGDSDRDLFLGDFWLRPLQITLLTDIELDFFLRNGWDDFSDWMAESNVDIANWARAT